METPLTRTAIGEPVIGRSELQAIHLKHRLKRPSLGNGVHKTVTGHHLSEEPQEAKIKIEAERAALVIQRRVFDRTGVFDPLEGLC